MAKNFPYFKFIATEWMTGDIVYESFAVQGLFINICALYWQRNGELSLEDINRRFKNPPELSEITHRFISVIDGLISVKFLDEQLIEAKHISKTNTENGKLGGRPKTAPILSEKPNGYDSVSETKAKKSKEEKEEEKEEEEEVNKSEFSYGKKGGLKKQKFSPPVIGDVEAFFESKGFNKEFARTAFDHYDLANWFDSNGKQVISWKSKMNTNWLTAENKLKHGLNTNPQNGKTIIKLGNIVS